MTEYACLECGRPYPDAFVHACPHCGGMFGVPDGILCDVDKIEKTAPGIWRYRDSFGLPAGAPEISLGEGSTPLVPAEMFGQQVWLKLESANPTGSYKDRLAAPLVSLLAAHGIREAVEDSSGNAGAAFAAYTARAGIKATVFVPESASGPKRAQIEAYGAGIVAVPGPRQAATEEALRVVKNGCAYGSHALVPHGLAGIATIAYELADQMEGELPGAVLVPAGHGGLLLGVILGFQALRTAGQINRLPHFIGIQAENNAPLWAAASGQNFVPRPTAAGGIAVQQPAHKGELLGLVEAGLVEFVTVSEDQIVEGHREFARMGFYMEPTSAVVWSVLKQRLGRITGDAVAIISGHGLKAG